TLGLGVYLFWPGEADLPESAATLRVGDYTLSGPYAHENLSVFLIHGKRDAAGKNYLTLEEALDQKKAVVKETGQMQERTVENLSASEDIFIQSGDILRGGQQDRVIQSDTIVAAKSGPVAVASFCVEQGRWQQRGNESVVQFSSSKEQLAGNALRMAN